MSLALLPLALKLKQRLAAPQAGYSIFPPIACVRRIL